jgi:hypothetical protein
MQLARSLLETEQPSSISNRTLLEADPWGGLFRAATTFTEASTGAEKSVGLGGSPKGSRLRLAWSDASTPKMTSVPRGRLKASSPFSVADSSETSPRVGNVELRCSLLRSYRLRIQSSPSLTKQDLRQGRGERSTDPDGRQCCRRAREGEVFLEEILNRSGGACKENS